MQAHDSFFVVGHFHYVLIGGALFPILAGVYYYFPIVRARKLSDRLGTLAFWITFVGFNVAFLPMHLTGLRGMPRRVFTYAPGLGFDGLNLISTVGAFILAAGLLVVLVDILRPRGKQPVVERNPWNAGTLEWVQEMPGEDWGIRSIPEVTSRYPIWDQPDIIREIDEGRGYLPDAEEGLRETVVTTVVEARPIQCLRLPGSSFLPMAAAVTLGGFFVFGTFHAWWPAMLCLALAVAVFVVWLWTGTARIPEKEHKDVGRGVRLPIYVSGSTSVGWWGVLITMLADVTGYVCLLFGYFFFWTIHDDFPPAGAGPEPFWPLAGAALATASWGATLLARRWNRRDATLAVVLALGASVVLAAGATAALLLSLAGLDPSSHAYPATVWVLVLWPVAHLGVGAIMQLYCLARRLAGRMTGRYDIDIHNVVLYGHFTLLMVVLTVGVVAGFPWVA